MHVRQPAGPSIPSGSARPAAPSARQPIAPGDLDEISDALAVNLGPMARVMVNRKARDAASVSALIETLSHELKSAEERAQFRARLIKLIGR
jgi:hypothetical protein